MSALVEKVILDEFGSKKKINYCDFGEQAEIPFEVANSNYINVKELNFFSKTNKNKSLGYRFDIILRGKEQTYFENKIEGS